MRGIAAEKEEPKYHDMKLRNEGEISLRNTIRDKATPSIGLASHCLSSVCRSPTLGDMITVA